MISAMGREYCPELEMSSEKMARGKCSVHSLSIFVVVYSRFNAKNEHMKPSFTFTFVHNAFACEVYSSLYSRPTVLVILVSLL